jgi:hypothetical protein
MGYRIQNQSSDNAVRPFTICLVIDDAAALRGQVTKKEQKAADRSNGTLTKSSGQLYDTGSYRLVGFSASNPGRAIGSARGYGPFIDSQSTGDPPPVAPADVSNRGR